MTPHRINVSLLGYYRAAPDGARFDRPPERSNRRRRPARDLRQAINPLSASGPHPTLIGLPTQFLSALVLPLFAVNIDRKPPR